MIINFSPYLILSILYLRCQLQIRPRRFRRHGLTFNSLFEMHYQFSDDVEIDLTVTFNSLFEMPDYGYAEAWQQILSQFFQFSI